MNNPCKNCIRIGCFFRSDTVRKCNEQVESNPNNADRIRAMSNEELENGIRVVNLGHDPWCDHHCKMQGDDNCNLCLRKWLESEVSE
jgi:isopentenyldiphosphate isomerase